MSHESKSSSWLSVFTTGAVCYILIQSFLTDEWTIKPTSIPRPIQVDFVIGPTSVNLTIPSFIEKCFGNPDEDDAIVCNYISRLGLENGPIKASLSSQDIVNSNSFKGNVDDFENVRHEILPEFRVGDSIPFAKSRRILLVATWRTGSSFFGSMLNNFPGTFYSYEPIHIYQSVDFRMYKNKSKLLDQR